MNPAVALPILGLILLCITALVWPALVDLQPVPVHHRPPPGYFLAQARARRDAERNWPAPQPPPPPGPLLDRTAHPRAGATWFDAPRAPGRVRPRLLDYGTRPMAGAPWPDPPRPHLRPTMPVTQEFVVPTALAGVAPQP